LRYSSRNRSISASTGSAITAGEGGQRRRERRQWTGRGVRRTAHGADLALGHARHQRADEIGFGGEVAVDRAGGDAGALGHRGDLDGRHAAIAGRLSCRGQDRVMAGRQAANDVFGAAIGHHEPRFSAIN
jgi:hypothetical protein